MLKIKLKPNGKIHQRSFRIVVSPDRSKSNGKFVDDIGFYTPQTKTLQIDKTKMAQWLKNGAQLTEGVDKLLNPDKYPRVKKVKKSTEAKTEKKEVKIEKTNQNPSAAVAASPLDKGDIEKENKIVTEEVVEQSQPVKQKVEEKTEEIKPEEKVEEVKTQE